MSTLCCRDLAVGYQQKPLLSAVNLSFPAGQLSCILGPNGSGKTTLLKTMARLLPPVAGTVLLQKETTEQSIVQLSRRQLAKELAVVLTTKPDLSRMTGREVVMMGRYPYTGFFGTLGLEDWALVELSLARSQALDLAERNFHELSDGQKQKIFLARGMAQATAVLLLDEPTNHLDIHYKLEVLSTLQQLCREEGKTIICTLHEPELALKCCDYLVLVGQGQVIEQGTAAEIIASGQLEALYQLRPGQLEGRSGIVEFTARSGTEFLLIGSDENTLEVMRWLQRQGRGFALALVDDQSVSCWVAQAMGVPIYFTEVEVLSALSQYTTMLATASVLQGQLPLAAHAMGLAVQQQTAVLHK